jgi:transmembrane sensor
MNTNQKDINWALIARCLSKEANEDESRQTQQWIEASEENNREFLKISGIWDDIQHLDRSDLFEPQAAFNKIKTKLETGTAQNNTQQKEKTVRLNKPLVSILKIAAFAIIFLAVGFVIYQQVLNINNRMIIVKTNDTEVKDVHLPDGTSVSLNSNSKIEYRADFENDVREVNLYGEGFFEVIPDKEKPFVVNLAQGKIKVLGTSFLARSHTLTEVVVVSGKVELSENRSLNNYFKPNKVTLEKGDKGILNEKTGQAVKTRNKDENYLSWKTKILTFSDTPLSEVAEKIEDVYKVEIKINNKKTREIPLSAKFDNRPVETVFKVIEKTCFVKIEHLGNNNYEIDQ